MASVFNLNNIQSNYGDNSEHLEEVDKLLATDSSEVGSRRCESGLHLKSKPRPLSLIRSSMFVPLYFLRAQRINTRDELKNITIENICVILWPCSMNSE